MTTLLLLEFGLVVLAIMAAVARRGGGRGSLGQIERWFGRLARQKTRAMLVVGLTALIAGGVPRLFEGIPRPQQYDEFSYLLGADTFAHARLTNPTHPMWEHFESFHILQKPTYMSMYQPGQALTLAAGQIIFGHPWFGVWISMAAMCAAICWMLQAWLPPGWALLGGLIAVMRIATFSYWIESYWGGPVAAFGGALVLGALPRLMRKGGWRNSLLLGAGVAILANTRPFEGLALAVPVAGLLAWWLVRAPRRWTVLAPATLVLCIAGAAMLHYNHAVTGNAFQLP
ncbi:MAG TPA: hypothetical protein VL285_14885 [Bryobacteraceae bacterium]|nr:hypothetical protein [Bryobacteraceae bacterium]